MRWFMRPRKAGFNNGPARLLTRNQAFDYYREAAWGSSPLGRLAAVENLHKGHKALAMNFVVWGEEVTNKELFRRILKGDVEPTREGL